jgi:hypothetical protein
MKFVKSPAVPGFFSFGRGVARRIAAGEILAEPCFYCSYATLQAYPVHHCKLSSTTISVPVMIDIDVDVDRARF